MCARRKADTVPLCLRVVDVIFDLTQNPRTDLQGQASKARVYNVVGVEPRPGRSRGGDPPRQQWLLKLEADLAALKVNDANYESNRGALERAILELRDVIWRQEC